MRADLSDDKSSQLGETAGDAVAQRPRRPRCIILSCTTPPKKCQQLALTADTVASCAAFSSAGMCAPPPPPLPGRGAVLKVYLTEEPGPKPRYES